MSDWHPTLNSDPLPWLLEPDPDNPGVRYFALVELLDRPANAPKVVETKHAVMTSGPVPAILDAQDPEGCWVKPGSGYSPKYRGTVWQIMFLAELGADPADERVRRGCEYVLSHSIAPNGAFSAYQKPMNSGAVHCLNGNLLYALQRLANALQFILSKQDDQGRGKLENSLTGKMWADIEEKGKPSKWITLRALRVLKRARVATT